MMLLILLELLFKVQKRKKKRTLGELVLHIYISFISTICSSPGSSKVYLSQSGFNRCAALRELSMLWQLEFFMNLEWEVDFSLSLSKYKICYKLCIVNLSGSYLIRGCRQRILLMFYDALLYTTKDCVRELLLVQGQSNSVGGVFLLPKQSWGLYRLYFIYYL